ncbi:aminoglycoside phosphotransferase family protein [Bradyrhizobium sp. ORS 86]|uniref:aminoglycoside phosphotransferase family protein n=1 Tax=Bradyrhizobium sp. ORS 86 TaxID=1685970 RepID=UPI0038911792
MFEPYLSEWSLVPDGSPMMTPAARLLPVRLRGEPAMLKLTTERDERLGAAVMEWWGGEGAARLLARGSDALLMERATGPASLSEMARTGRQVGCDAARALVSRAGARRLLSWIVAWTGLSPARFLGDGDPLAEIAPQIAKLAAAELDRMA